ncbi:MAG: Ku protein [Actinomycetota bacterium]
MPPRSIWRGAITFGLITIPVKIYTAVGRERDEALDFHLLHEKDGARIHYERVCAKGHKDIDWDEIVKGHEYSKGKWVEITDEELEALDLESLHTIDVVSFAPLDQIDPMYFDKTYYVVPDQGAIKAYKLMTEALEEEGLVGVAKVALREREHLSALRLTDGMLVLQTMHWPEEIREPRFEELRKRPKVNDRERKMARQLIKQLTDDFDPTQFRDEYHKALKKLVKKKIKGEEIVIHEEPEEKPEVIDLMEALKASVEAARRGERPKLKPRPGRRAAGDGKVNREDLVSLTRQDLEAQAKKLDIAGRSKMDKRQLIRAIQKAS